jgi:hypothetical protein
MSKWGSGRAADADRRRRGGLHPPGPCSVDNRVSASVHLLRRKLELGWVQLCHSGTVAQFAGSNSSCAVQLITRKFSYRPGGM